MSEQPEYAAVQFTRHVDGKLRQAGGVFWEWRDGGDMRMLTLDPHADSPGVAPWLSREEQKLVREALLWAATHIHMKQYTTAFTEAISLLQSRLYPEERQP